jgi:hypothetical protein
MQAGGIPPSFFAITEKAESIQFKPGMHAGGIPPSFAITEKAESIQFKPGIQAGGIPPSFCVVEANADPAMMTTATTNNKRIFITFSSSCMAYLPMHKARMRLFDRRSGTMCYVTFFRKAGNSDEL